jgi:N-acetylmuramoyl-L-alanine amidase
MIDLVRRAGKAAAFLAFAVTASATPALAADGATVSTAAAEAAASPGLGSLEDIVERAIAAPAAAEAGKPAPVPTLAAPALPAPERGASLEQLVSQYAADQARDTEAECLASAVYFESNGEPLAGQLAVAEVIINRARSGRFASTLCGVITQRSQFSFVRGGRIPTPPRGAAWRTSVAIAHIALDDLADSPVSTALFFHARYVSPRWRLQRLAAVGNHIFYR